MINIRLAASTDAVRISELHTESWNFAYSDIVPLAILGKYTSRFDFLWTKMLEHNVDSHYLIECDGKLVGFLTLSPARDDDLKESHCEMVALYLSPEYIGKGFGRQAMEWAKAEARERGYKFLALWVLELNLRARHFYEKAGFESDGKSKPSGLGDTVELRYICGI